MFITSKKEKSLVASPVATQVAESKGPSINDIDSVTVYPESTISVPVRFTGQEVPFTFFSRDIWKLIAHHSPADTGDAATTLQSDSFVLGLQTTNQPVGANPQIFILAYKNDNNPSSEALSAAEICEQSQIAHKSLVINGYAACYQLDTTHYSGVKHLYTISNGDYSVQLSFQEKYQSGSSGWAGDIMTEISYTHFLPEFKTIVYSVKFQN